MSQPSRRAEPVRRREASAPPACAPALPGPRALWPHERVAAPRCTRHPSAAFPLMAPAAAQGRPRGAGPRLDARVDALLAEAQQALDRMRARAQMMREALREARQLAEPPARARFEVPRPR